VSERVKEIFNTGNKLEKLVFGVSKGIFTGNNEYFLKYWYEINGLDANWHKYSKSGGNSRWYGLLLYVLRWKNNGEKLKNFSGAGLGASKYYDKNHIVWSGLTSGDISFRYENETIWFDDVAPAIIFNNHKFNTDNSYLLALCNNKITNYFLKLINPTFHYQIGDIKKIPIIFPKFPEIKRQQRNIVGLCSK